jgi:hypothetical protein
VIGQQLLEELLWWLSVMLWDLLERSICWCEDSEIGNRAIEEVNEIIKLVDELSQLGGVFALCNELIYSQVWLAMVGWVMRPLFARAMSRRTMVWRAMVRWAMMGWLVGLVE